MAVALGKRKRTVDAPVNRPSQESDRNSEDDDNVRTLFQRAFEAKFKPLDASLKLKIEKSPTEWSNCDKSESRQSSPSDWSGISDHEDGVEVFEHDDQQLSFPEDAIRDKKAFMSSKPPNLQNPSLQSNQAPSNKKDPPEDKNETANLQNDIALQRLLKESHLLDSTSFNNNQQTSGGGSSSTAQDSIHGKGRLKALDLRLQDLGAKKSSLRQERMPLAHRKGIVAKSALRETNRRKEAKENGVILEKAKMMTKSPTTKKRDRGIGGPGVGKFQGGTLKLSSKDVRSIEGRRNGSSRRAKGKGKLGNF